jgi:hypothetical protein
VITRHRRLTFQLVSLFDLLIIIVFAQYFGLREKTQAEMADIAREAEANAGGTQFRKELDQRTLELEAVRAESARKELELSEDLKRTRGDLTRLGTLVAEMFNLPSEALEQVLRAHSPAEAERIRKAVRDLSANRSSEAVRHILTLAELEKRCDLWQVHIRDDGGYVFTANDHTSRFRADSPERFASELFKQYKSLPQPKSLVLILLSWGDAALQSRTAAVDGLELVVDRMRADTDRRSRFEYSLLGYIPQKDQ